MNGLLGLLPDEVAVQFLTTAVLENRAPLPSAAIDEVSDPGRWDAEPIRQLIDEALQRFSQTERTAADAWLAPVLHATLRLTRREASDSRLWNYLAMRLAPDYVFWRHLSRQPGEGVTRARFVGPFHTQTFARLWWAAELFRDGPDYAPVVVACGNQDVLNTVMRLDVTLHRPTAQAIVRLLSAGVIRTGREVNALAQAVNAAGSTLSYEALAPDSPRDVDAYRDWIEELKGVLVPYDSLPEGPDDGRVQPRSINALVELFQKFLDELSSATAISD